MIDTTGFKEIHPDKVQEERKKEVEKKQEFMGSMTPKKGHTMFEVDLLNQKIRPAQFEKVTKYEEHAEKPKSDGLGVIEYKDGSKKLVIDKLPNISKKLLGKEGCIYVSALNKKNLIKKLVKRGVIKIVDKNE